MDLEVGPVLEGKYSVERLVGRGSMGPVYAARDSALDRRVAIRLIEPACDNDRVAAFNENDATVAGQPGNIHVAEVISVGFLPSGERCIVTEFVEGETLQRRMKQLGCMSELGVMQLLAQLLEGLAVVHEKGVIHRDLTPRSIFIVPGTASTGDVVRIIDFGISRLQLVMANHQASAAAMDGDVDSFQYLSPEQLNGLHELDPRSNIYTLGVIAYEAITGRLPFEGNDFGALAYNIRQADPKPVEELVLEPSSPFAQLVRKAMARSPSDRFQSAEEMFAAIAQWAKRVRVAQTAPESGKSQEELDAAKADASESLGHVNERSEAAQAEAAAEAAAQAAAQAAAAAAAQAAEAAEVAAAAQVAAAAAAAAQVAAEAAAAAAAEAAAAVSAPPPPAVEETDLGNAAAVPPVDDSAFRPWQSTEPGIHPSPAAISTSTRPAARWVQPAPRTVPVTRAATATRAAPATRAATVTRAATATRAAPATRAQPVSNVQPQPEVAATDDQDEPAPYEKVPLQSRKPLVLAILLIGLAGAGVAFALLPSRLETTKSVAPEAAPSAAEATNRQVVSVSAPTHSTESAAVAPSVEANVAAQIDAGAKDLASSSRKGATPPLQSPEIPKAAAVTRPTRPKALPPVRAAQSAPKPPAATPSTKLGTAKRASDKDPYNYR